MNETKRIILIISSVIILSCAAVGMYFEIKTCPLPDFTILTDGFAEQKIFMERFILIIPMEGGGGHSTANYAKMPKLRYLPAHERIQIKEAFDNFWNNYENGNSPRSTVSGVSRRITITKGSKVIVSQLWTRYPDPAYFEDFAYKGAVELLIQVTKSSPFYSNVPSIKIINEWIASCSDGVTPVQYTE